MHICSAARWLLTTVFAVFEYGMAYDSPLEVKCLACAHCAMVVIILMITETALDPLMSRKTPVYTVLRIL